MPEFRAVAVIPARYASSRYPGKPLAKETGKFLIQHVYEQVRFAPLISEVIVATDDQRIADAVASFGGRVVMTRADHPSGTDRIAEVAEGLECDMVVNVQGDEPEIEPVSIAQLVELLQDHPECEMATLACPFKLISGADPKNPNAVKVRIDHDNIAIDFSRALSESETNHESRTTDHGPLLHLGIYAYRRDFLLKFPKMAPTPLEKSERLEQMRAVENGHKIAVGLVRRAAVGIDTPEDYVEFVNRWRQAHGQPPSADG
jgi:3-deoxy-manno-octulosonate cytidylyltransferase (CMP-KDO synthetase)